MSKIYEVWTEERDTEESPLSVDASSLENAAKQAAVYWDGTHEHEDQIRNSRPVVMHVRLQAIGQPWTTYEVSGRVTAHYDPVLLVTVGKP